MEINLAGVVIAILLILIIASFACMVLLMLLQTFGLIRFSKTSHFIAWSIGGGIALAIIFWEIKKYSGSADKPGKADTISVQPDSTRRH
jgi:hypothetical protein